MILSATTVLISGNMRKIQSQVFHRKKLFCFSQIAILGITATNCGSTFHPCYSFEKTVKYMKELSTDATPVGLFTLRPGRTNIFIATRDNSARVKTDWIQSEMDYAYWEAF